MRPFYIKQNLQCAICGKAVKKDGFIDKKTKRLVHGKCVKKLEERKAQAEKGEN